MQMLDPPPCWYTVLALLWSGFQGARGVVETRIANADKEWRTWQKVVVLDIHDFVFRFVCTFAGFASLLVAFRVVTVLPEAGEISAGEVALLASSFLLGVVGVGGQLHYLVLLGKVPGAR